MSRAKEPKLVDRRYVRLFIAPDCLSACNCPELLCNVQATRPSVSRNETQTQSLWNCVTGRYEVVRKKVGELGDVTLDLRQPQYIDRNILRDMHMRGCTFDLILAYGTCKDQFSIADADGWEIIRGVTTNAFGGDDLFTSDEDNGEQLVTLYETITLQAEGFDYTPLFGRPTYEQIALPATLNDPQQIIRANVDGCEGSASNCNQCGDVVILDTAADGTSDIYVATTDGCDPAWCRNNLGVLAYEIAETPLGLLVLTDDGAGGTGYFIMSWDCLCDDDIVHQPTGIVLLDDVVGSVSICGTTAFMGGAAAVINTLDLLSGSPINGAVDSPAGDVLAFDCCDENCAIGVGNAGSIYLTEDGGENFILQPSPTTRSITNVSMCSCKEWTIVNSIGEVFQTTDGGASYVQVLDSVLSNLIGTRAGALAACCCSMTLFGVSSGSFQPFTTIDCGCSWLRPKCNTGSALKLDDVIGVAGCCDSPDEVTVLGTQGGAPVLYQSAG